MNNISTNIMFKKGKMSKILNVDSNLKISN